MTPITTAAAIALVLAAVAVPHSPANAVSGAVKAACASDYFAHCSAHAVGSPGLRQCMRAVGRNLSKGCINALVAAGEVSKTEVSRRATASGR